MVDLKLFTTHSSVAVLHQLERAMSNLALASSFILHNAATDENVTTAFGQTVYETFELIYHKIVNEDHYKDLRKYLLKKRPSVFK